MPSQRYRLLMRNMKKREKFIQPLIKDDEIQPKDTESFFSIVKNKNKAKKREEEPRNYFISPMRGRVPDRSTFPIYSRGNVSKQYDFIRPKEKQKEPEFRSNYGEFLIFRPSQSNRQHPSEPVNEEVTRMDHQTNDHSNHQNQLQPQQHTPHQQEKSSSPFIFTEHITFGNERKDEPSQTVYHEESLQSKDTTQAPSLRPNRRRQTVNVLYEEEIELSHDRSVITSYDENHNQFYFGDYEKYHLNQNDFMNDTMNEQHKNIHVTDYSGHHPEVLREIKEIFSDVTMDTNSNQDKIYDYEENINLQSNSNVDENVNKTSVPNRQEPIFFEENLDFSTLEETRIPVRKKEAMDNSFQTTRTLNSNPQQKFKDLKHELDQALNELTSEDVKEPQVVNSASVEPEADNDLTNYQFPPLELLNPSSEFETDQSSWAESQMQVLDETLESFGIPAHTVDYTIGPSVTRFEVEPEPGTKVSRITSLTDDIQLRLAARDIFVKAPIAGKSTVGIEIPNIETRMVNLREILESPSYQNIKSPLKIALGLDIAGEPVFSDISAMTHTLIAGSTGSGKSVCINSIIVSILYNALPSDVKLVLIDPKKVEFAQYRDIPHLLTPVINDPKEATATLKWLTEEMDRRYDLIESVGARDIRSYNIKRSRNMDELPKLPYIVVIIDELADLMMVAMNEVEDYIQRIAQLARAAGIHLIVATQRPSANVITGTIKTNIPSRIAFRVASQVDSRIILDTGGAERLLGKGDMLFIENGKSHMIRVQGSFISDDEIERITDFCRMQAKPNYQFFGEDLVEQNNSTVIEYEDELFDDAVRFVIEMGEASASRLQRHFKVGYNRAARMIDMMEQMNIIAPHTGGSKPREVLISLDEYERMLRNLQ